MKNPRITPKERGLIKGALRRVFSRSEIRRAAVDLGRVAHHDTARPRVTKWSVCPICETLTPTYLVVVDHIKPIVPIGVKFDDMSVDTLIDNLWCPLTNLQAICQSCHKLKSKAEAKSRAATRKKLRSKRK